MQVDFLRYSDVTPRRNLCDNEVMTDDTNPRQASFLNWKRQNEFRVSDIARKADIPYSTVDSFVKRPHAKMLAENEAKIAAAYGVSVAEIFEQTVFFGNVPAQKRDHAATGYRNKDSVNGNTNGQKIPSQTVRISHKVPVLGYVEAGAWREMSEYSEALEVVPYYDPDLAGKELFGLRVRGSSMNLKYPEGTTIMCEPYPGALLRQGDFVVMRRMDGLLAETTVKQLEVERGGKWKFWPRSNDPRFQEPLIPPARNESQQAGWEIIGVVVGTAQRELRLGEVIQDGMPV